MGQLTRFLGSSGYEGPRDTTPAMKAWGEVQSAAPKGPSLRTLQPPGVTGLPQEGAGRGAWDTAQVTEASSTGHRVKCLPTVIPP